jgi:hypothetical protein
VRVPHTGWYFPRVMDFLFVNHFVDTQFDLSSDHAIRPAWRNAAACGRSNLLNYHSHTSVHECILYHSDCTVCLVFVRWNEMHEWICMTVIVGEEKNLIDKKITIWICKRLNVTLYVNIKIVNNYNRHNSVHSSLLQIVVCCKSRRMRCERHVSLAVGRPVRKTTTEI